MNRCILDAECASGGDRPADESEGNALPEGLHTGDPGGFSRSLGETTDLISQGQGRALPGFELELESNPSVVVL